MQTQAVRRTMRATNKKVQIIANIFKQIKLIREVPKEGQKTRTNGSLTHIVKNRSLTRSVLLALKGEDEGANISSCLHLLIFPSIQYQGETQPLQLRFPENLRGRPWQQFLS